MAEKKTYVYDLSETLRYTPEGAGDFKDTASIEFSGPSMSTWDQSTKLSELVAQAMIGYTDKAKKDPEEEDTDKKNETPGSAEIKVLLMGAKDVSFRDICEAFKSLALKVGKLDEKTYIKLDHFKNLEIEDFYDMTCGYISNFIFPSLFPEEVMKGNG